MLPGSRISLFCHCVIIKKIVEIQGFNSRRQRERGGGGTGFVGEMDQAVSTKKGKLMSYLWTILPRRKR